MADDFIQYVEMRLEQWADWYSRGNLFGLGYPSVSIEYRLIHEGIVYREFGPKPIQRHEAAEEMESLVKEMAAQNENMALALRCQYFSHGSLRKKAKQLALSHTQFKYYLDMARQWLAGRLSGRGKQNGYP